MTNKSCWRNMTLTGSTFMISLIMLMYRALRHQSRPWSSVTWRLAKDKIRYDRYHTCLFVYISIKHTRVALRLLCSCHSFNSIRPSLAQLELPSINNKIVWNWYFVSTQYRITRICTFSNRTVQTPDIVMVGQPQLANESSSSWSVAGGRFYRSILATNQITNT